MKEEILNSLNVKQKEAVLAIDGPVLVFAGAGTGKTRVITHRIAYLIEKGVSPYRILAVTFTNKAAEQMRNRVNKLVEGKGESVWISTFHSLGCSILRKEYPLLNRNGNFTIYDEEDQLSVIKDSIDKNQISTKLKPKVFLEIINRAKDELLDADSYSLHSLIRDDSFRYMVSFIYSEYQNKLNENCAVDFGDLIMNTVFLFKDYPAILEKYQERFKYIMVDEYQDTNHAQYILMRLLAGKYKNICVVGDDDQSIYSWRGAKPENIFNFEKDFPQAKTINLERNYRSTQIILDASYKVISNNEKRKEKKLWTDRKEGFPLEYYSLEDEIEEANFICGRIKKLNEEQNLMLEDIAVFYRTNAQSRVFEEAFTSNGLNYNLVGTIKFYERKEIKDVISYLRLIQNSDDNLSLKRVINLPPRGIGNTTLEIIERYSNKKGQSLFSSLEEIENIKSGLSPKVITKIKEFVDLIKRIKEKDFSSLKEMVIELLDKTGYYEFLRVNETEHFRVENVEELVSAISEFEENNKNADLSSFLERVSLSISEPQQKGRFLKKEQNRGVTLMTLHLAKGLEFAAVFITGLEERLFPHRDALKDEYEMEEERRLCYVGMTRAKRYLFLTSTKQRRIYGNYRYNIPSRFIRETGIKTLSNKTEIGARVIHKEFGEGRVLESVGEGEEKRLTVMFSDGSLKRILLKYADLKFDKL